MKTIVTLLLLVTPMFAHADELRLPRSLDAYRETLAHSFLKGYFFVIDSQIPGEGRPTYSITLTRGIEQTGDVNVYRFVRTAPGQTCGGIIYQNIAGASSVASTNCN